MSKVNINEIDLEDPDSLEELNENFEKIPRKKKFDDETTASKHSRKKDKKRVDKELPESD